MYWCASPRGIPLSKRLTGRSAEGRVAPETIDPAVLPTILPHPKVRVEQGADSGHGQTLPNKGSSSSGGGGKVEAKGEKWL